MFNYLIDKRVMISDCQPFPFPFPLDVIHLSELLESLNGEDVLLLSPINCFNEI